MMNQVSPGRACFAGEIWERSSPEGEASELVCFPLWYCGGGIRTFTRNKSSIMLNIVFCMTKTVIDTCSIEISRFHVLEYILASQKHHTEFFLSLSILGFIRQT